MSRGWLLSCLGGIPQYDELERLTDLDKSRPNSVPPKIQIVELPRAGQSIACLSIGGLGYLDFPNTDRAHHPTPVRRPHQPFVSSVLLDSLGRFGGFARRHGGRQDGRAFLFASPANYSGRNQRAALIGSSEHPCGHQRWCRRPPARNLIVCARCLPGPMHIFVSTLQVSMPAWQSLSPDRPMPPGRLNVEWSSTARGSSAYAESASRRSRVIEL